MRNIADFEYNLAPLSEGVIRISLAVRADFPADSVRQQLRSLSDDARAQIPEELNQDEQLSQLLQLFYHTWGFGGVGGVYRLSDALWLDNVLERRQGLPASLGIILLHVAQALNIPLSPVIFPTQMILRAGWLDGEMWLINPINGDTLDEHTLDIWLRGNIGLGEEKILRLKEDSKKESKEK